MPTNTEEILSGTSQASTLTQVHPLTATEVRAWYNKIEKLSDQLYRELRGCSQPAWCGAAREAFTRFLRAQGLLADAVPSWRLPLPTLEDVENWVRARYASADTNVDESPSVWLLNLERYRTGPRNADGVPLVRVEEERARQAAQRAEEQRKAKEEAEARKLRSREFQGQRAASIVLGDLRRKRFVIFAPVGAAPGFNFLACPPGRPTSGFGILIVVGDPEKVGHKIGVTQAVVRPGADMPVSSSADLYSNLPVVTYIPALP
jgi:hypothetical protein